MMATIAAVTALFTALAPGHCMLTRVFRTSGTARWAAAVGTSGTARWAAGFDPIGDAGKRQQKGKRSFNPDLAAVQTELRKKNPKKLEALQRMLEEVKELVDQIKEMSKDPETKLEFQNIWKDLMERALKPLAKLKDNPNFAEMKADLMKHGYEGLPKAAEKYQNSEQFYAATRAMLEAMRRRKTIKKGTEGMIKEMFDKFDVDADGVLNLDEYNALQLVTEGDEATCNAAQLEELVRSLNPKCEEPAQGLPFEEFRFIYAEAYPEALEKDHAKVFGPSSKV